jgi:hypothetical protein
MQEEQERNEAQRELNRSIMGSPFRFFCPSGETREIVVVDDAPDFFRYEHNLQNQRTKKWDIFVACINDHSNCPVCKETERGNYYAMYLTVVDLTGYTNRDGDEVPWSKKLLVVKQQQQKKIMRLYERHGTLRGMVLQMTRDGDKDANIGNDIEFLEFMDEDELATYQSEYTDQNGKKHEVDGSVPFDYDAIFPTPTEQQLRAIVGGKAEAGSREDDDRELGRGRGRGGDDDGGDNWNRGERRSGGREAARSERSERSRPARGRDGDDADLPPADDEPTSNRTSRAAVRGRGREAEPEQEEAPARRAAVRGRGREEPAEPAEDDPPQRTRAAATRTRRAEPEDDVAEDVPPARRPAQSMAERRRALRR